MGAVPRLIQVLLAAYRSGAWYYAHYQENVRGGRLDEWRGGCQYSAFEVAELFFSYICEVSFAIIVGELSVLFSVELEVKLQSEITCFSHLRKEFQWREHPETTEVYRHSVSQFYHVLLLPQIKRWKIWNLTFVGGTRLAGDQNRVRYSALRSPCPLI